MEEGTLRPALTRSSRRNKYKHCISLSGASTVNRSSKLPSVNDEAWWSLVYMVLAPPVTVTPAALRAPDIRVWPLTNAGLRNSADRLEAVGRSSPRVVWRRRWRWRDMMRSLSNSSSKYWSLAPHGGLSPTLVEPALSLDDSYTHWPSVSQQCQPLPDNDLLNINPLTPTAAI